MGNLQTADTKSTKPVKSPGGKAGRIKRRFARKKDDFVNLVPEEEQEVHQEEPTIEEKIQRGSVTPDVENGGGNNQQSSSDSVFTDPQLDFSTEVNQCYYSRESVLDTKETQLQSLNVDDINFFSENDTNLLDAPEFKNIFNFNDTKTFDCFNR